MRLPTRKNVIALSAAALLVVAPTMLWAGYEEGMGYFKAGKWVEAAAEFQALVDQSPEYDFGYYVLGMSFLKLNKLPDAEKNLRKAIDLNGDKFEYHYGLAKALVERRQYRETVRVLNDSEGLAANSSHKFALHSLRGFSYAAQKKWAEAIDDLEGAQRIKKSQANAVQLGKAYAALGHNDKAVPVFREALASNPNDFDTQQLMAVSLIEMGRGASSDAAKQRYYTEGLAAAEKCRALRPDDFEAINLVGRAALGANDFPKAAAAFRQVLKLKPDYCYAMINLGKTHIAQAQWDSAEKPLLDAMRCSPREVTIYENLGLIYQKYGKNSQESGQNDKALQQYDQALQFYGKAREIKASGFVAEAVETIKKNIDIIRHNKDMSELEAKQAAEEEAERKRVEEEERKRKEWEKKRQQGD